MHDKFAMVNSLANATSGLTGVKPFNLNIPLDVPFRWILLFDRYRVVGILTRRAILKNLAFLLIDPTNNSKLTALWNMEVPSGSLPYFGGRRIFDSGGTFETHPKQIG